MKYPLILVLTVSMCVAYAQKPVAPPSQRPTPSAGPLSKEATPQDSRPMGELDYYKQLAEQAQAQMDKMREDIKWNYSLNVTTIAIIFAALLGLQYFANTKELKRAKSGIIDELNTRKGELDNETKTALGDAQAANIELINIRLNQAINFLDARIKPAVSSQASASLRQDTPFLGDTNNPNDVLITEDEKTRLGTDSSAIIGLVRPVVDAIQPGNAVLISDTLDNLENGLSAKRELDNGAYRRVFDIFPLLSLRKSEFPQLDRIHALMREIDRVGVNYNDPNSSRKTYITRAESRPANQAGSTSL